MYYLQEVIFHFEHFRMGDIRKISIFLQKKKVDDILQKRQNLLKELQVLQNG